MREGSVLTFLGKTYVIIVHVCAPLCMCLYTPGPIKRIDYEVCMHAKLFRHNCSEDGEDYEKIKIP